MFFDGATFLFPFGCLCISCWWLPASSWPSSPILWVLVFICPPLLSFPHSSLLWSMILTSVSVSSAFSVFLFFCNSFGVDDVWKIVIYLLRLVSWGSFWKIWNYFICFLIVLAHWSFVIVLFSVFLPLHFCFFMFFSFFKLGHFAFVFDIWKWKGSMACNECLKIWDKSCT